MIYIETGSADVCYNFGAEYYFTVEKPLEDTVFLFWRTTPTLMVGRYQNVLEEVDRAYATAHGIRIVRRMSGGGTIYTDPGGWQFTFIEDAREEDIQFQRYIAPVTGALAELGGEASFNGRNDLTVGGKKISGNAQYRLGGRVVHHGSLLFDTDLEQMAAATTVDRYKIQSKSIPSVRERVTNIAWHLPAPMDAEAFKAKIVEHILGPEGTVYVITPEDGRRIRELGEERFASWESSSSAARPLRWLDLPPMLHLPFPGKGMCCLAVSGNAENNIPRLLSLDYRLPVCLQDPVQGIDVERILLQRILANPDHRSTSQSNFRYGDPPA